MMGVSKCSYCSGAWVDRARKSFSRCIDWLLDCLHHRVLSHLHVQVWQAKLFYDPALMSAQVISGDLRWSQLLVQLLCIHLCTYLLAVHIHVHVCVYYVDKSSTFGQIYDFTVCNAQHQLHTYMYVHAQ